MKVVFCDIDNALSSTAHRDHLMFEKRWDEYNAMCGADEPIYECIRLLAGYYERGYTVVLVSGRSEDTQEATKEWLMENDVYYHRLFLRSKGDKSPNKVFKMRVVNAYINDSGSRFAVAIEPIAQTAAAMSAHPHKPLILRVMEQ